MTFFNYLKDKLYAFILFTFVYGLLLLLFFAFKISYEVIIAFSIIFFIFFLSLLIIDYFRKRNFYRTLLSNIEKLDKSYLVLETINTPNFYEGELLTKALYEINKSMNENIKYFESQMIDFKEFIEMWIHEIKIPISSLILMAHNHKDNFDKTATEQIRKIENYVEQVLYYVRQEKAEKDYLINEVSLDKVITKVALKNKDDFLENKIDLLVDNINCKIYTDSKWLEFIINQIINNSIKYKRENINSYIKISLKEEFDKIILIIEDNGIGIPTSDISRVFEKSFTGINGRKTFKSTGMGLFICKNLCNKLGHKISIESKLRKYTRVYITFFKNEYFEVVK